MRFVRFTRGFFGNWRVYWRVGPVTIYSSPVIGRQRVWGVIVETKAIAEVDQHEVDAYFNSIGAYNLAEAEDE